MTQEELAAKLGVAKSTVANWETGKHFPKRKLGAVEAALGVSLDEDPEGPQIPPDILAAIELAYPGPENAATRERYIEGFRRIAEGIGTSAPAAAAGPGRHRRAV